MLWHTALGAVTSCTVTVAPHVALFPCTSVTVNTTALPPTLAHVKLLGATLRP